jgi:HEAT repeats
MHDSIPNTSRRVSKLLAISGTCAILAACSKQNNSDWFRFGKNNTQEPTQQETAQNDSNSNHTEILHSPDSHTDPDSVATESNESVPTRITEPAQAEPKTVPAEPIEHTAQPDTQSTTDVDEIVRLYRRLHVEMEPTSRSQLIVELLNDPRERVQLLGFDLASRDLSSGATLSAQAANAAVNLLNAPLPSVRTGAARLITRLALPDAMTLLTNALTSEDNPTVAESILQGLQRWPNPEARDDVLHWYQSSGPVRAAAAAAAWGLADLNLWNRENDAHILRSVYQSLPDAELTDADLKLIASTGTSTDIQRLINLARDPENPARTSATSALVHTPRGVDPLVSIASKEPAYSPTAATAIESHRLNPEGIRRLAALPWTDPQARTESIIRACDKLDHDQLASAVRLSRSDNSIDDTLSIRLLSRLVAGAQTVSARSVPGVVMLAALELNNQRPDRALEIISLLPESGIDPDSSLQANTTKVTAHILLAEYDQAASLDTNANTWISAINQQPNQHAKVEIAQQIITRDFNLSDPQRATLESLIESATPSTSESDTPTDTQTE